MRTLICLMLSAAALAAQEQQPQPYTPTAAEKGQIEAKSAELGALLDKLQQNALYADVAIYRKAGEFILRHPEEFANAGYVKDTLAALDKGIARAKELAAGSPSWTKSKGRLVRAYVSSVDGSVQPYGLIIPESYSGQPIRLDIWMHGTNRNLNEVAFIKQHETATPVPPEQGYIQMDVYGRSNVAYRWAGETDVFEALQAVEKQYKIDPKRVALRGFSMGGAGAWNLGLHHPDEWAAMEAGAGFTETKIYAKKDTLPAYQEAALHYYDAVDYSLNATNFPFVGYGGELDAQLQASKNVKEQLLKEGINVSDFPALFLVGPGVAHKWNPDTHKISEHFVAEAVAKGLEAPSHIRFVTYTTRFNRCFWVTVEELEKHYERADVDAKREGSRTTATTRNVARILIDGPGQVSLDGQEFPSAGVFEKINGKWAKGRTDAGLRKRHGLQGPVDDAFVESFLCVRPTGKRNSGYGVRPRNAEPPAKRFLQMAARRAAGEGRSRRNGLRYRQQQPDPFRRSLEQQRDRAGDREAARPMDQGQDHAGRPHRGCFQACGGAGLSESAEPETVCGDQQRPYVQRFRLARHQREPLSAHWRLCAGGSRGPGDGAIGLL